MLTGVQQFIQPDLQSIVYSRASRVWSMSRLAIAVGTALTGGPPHRSQRAGLPHWAPALGVWRQSVPPGRGA